MSGQIDYPSRIQDALRKTVADILAEVAEEGLPGDHHFYIAFDTTHPGVDIPDWMHNSYPEEMTIVIQHWFENLAVMNDRFAITLSFNNTPEPMVIPLAALRSFGDPSVQFMLRFDTPDDEHEGAEQEDGEQEGAEQTGAVEEAPMAEDAGDDTDDSPDDGASKGAAVISLDKFR